MNECPNKFALRKSQQIFLRQNIFVQNILIYSNIRLFAQDCFGIFSYVVLFGPILNHYGPIITIFNHFWGKIKNKIYSLSKILDEWIAKYIS